MGDQGFDDAFNDGLFRTSLSASIRKRPERWPKSPSEMRRYTDYSLNGHLHEDTGAYETAHSDFQLRRPYDTMNQGGRPPYYTQPSFYKPPLQDLASPLNNQLWSNAPYVGPAYWDPARGGYVWIASPRDR
jgi:hypothetical protein